MPSRQINDFSQKRKQKKIELVARPETFQENGRAYAPHERPGANAMSQFLIQGGLLLNDLASNQVPSQKTLLKKVPLD